MKWCIYAIREIGGTEARYIGQSGKSAECRMAEFIRFAYAGIGDPFKSEWIRSVDYQIEAVVIATAATVEDARRIERDAVRMFSQFGHRLFNRALIDPALKIPYRPRPTKAESAAAA